MKAILPIFHPSSTARLASPVMSYRSSAYARLLHLGRGPFVRSVLAATAVLSWTAETAAQTRAGSTLNTLSSWRGPFQHEVAGASLVTPAPSLLDAANVQVSLPVEAMVAETRLFWWGSGITPDNAVDLRLPNETLRNITVDAATDCVVTDTGLDKSFWQCTTLVSLPAGDPTGEYRLEGLSADIDAPYDSPCEVSGEAACSEYVAAFALVLVYVDPQEIQEGASPARLTQISSGLSYLQYVGGGINEPLPELQLHDETQGRLSVITLEGDPVFPVSGICDDEPNDMGLPASLDRVDMQGRPLCEFLALCDGDCTDEASPDRLSPESALVVFQNEDNPPGLLFNGSVAGNAAGAHAFDLDVFDLSNPLIAGTYEGLRIGVQTGQDAMMVALTVITIDEADQDGDGLSDLYEEELGTNPEQPDSDGDRIWDGIEVFGGYPGDANNNTTDPLRADTDGDGLCDGANHVENSLVSCVSGEDTNGNGVKDPGETDPNAADTDEDGLSDGTEVLSNYPGPFDNYSLRPGAQTNPLNADSDNDGLLDGEEDRNANGLYDAEDGETNPTAYDGDAGITSPDGGSTGGTETDAGSDPIMPSWPDAGPGSACGDGICDGEETETSCPEDCDGLAAKPDAGAEDDEPKLDVAGSAFYNGCGAIEGATFWSPFALLTVLPLWRRRRRN